MQHNVYNSHSFMTLTEIVFVKQTDLRLPFRKIGKVLNSMCCSHRSNTSEYNTFVMHKYT